MQTLARRDKPVAAAYVGRLKVGLRRVLLHAHLGDRFGGTVAASARTHEPSTSYEHTTHNPSTKVVNLTHGLNIADIVCLSYVYAQKPSFSPRFAQSLRTSVRVLHST